MLLYEVGENYLPPSPPMAGPLPPYPRFFLPLRSPTLPPGLLSVYIPYIPYSKSKQVAIPATWVSPALPYFLLISAGEDWFNLEKKQVALSVSRV